MPTRLIAASLALTLAATAPGLAQTQAQNPACSTTKALNAQSSPSSAAAPGASTADTSSDAGNAGTGASSASIGTGNIDKTGVNNPCVPATTGHGATGALPQNKQQ